MSRYVERHEEIISDDGFLQRVHETVKIYMKFCPFCGGNAHHTYTYDEDGNEKQIIQCSKCEAQTALFDELEDAVEAWNARV